MISFINSGKGINLYCAGEGNDKPLVYFYHLNGEHQMIGHIVPVDGPLRLDDTCHPAKKELKNVQSTDGN